MTEVPPANFAERSEIILRRARQLEASAAARATQLEERAAALPEVLAGYLAVAGSSRRLRAGLYTLMSVWMILALAGAVAAAISFVMGSREWEVPLFETFWFLFWYHIMVALVLRGLRDPYARASRRVSELAAEVDAGENSSA